MKRMCLIQIEDPKLHPMLRTEEWGSRLAKELVAIGVASSCEVKTMERERPIRQGILFEASATLTKEDIHQIAARTLGRVNEFVYFFEALYEPSSPLPVKLRWLSQEVHGTDRCNALVRVCREMGNEILAFVCARHGVNGDEYIIDAAVVREAARFYKRFQGGAWLYLDSGGYSVTVDVEVTATLHHILSEEHSP